MDTSERSDPNVQGSSPADPFLHPDWGPGFNPDPANASAPRIGRRSIIRGLADQWWQILLLWLLVSTPLAYLIYMFVEPTYEARSLLRAGPTTTNIYGPEPRRPPTLDDDKPYLLTQLKLIVSDRVLDQALADPAISNLPMIRSSKDPKSDIRQRMRVGVVDDSTYLIQISLSSRDPAEAAAIVNAVVEAYTSEHTRYQQAANRSLKKNLETERDKLVNQIVATQKELTALVKAGRVTVDHRLDQRATGNEDDGAAESSLSSVTEEQYVKMTDRQIQADYELMDARARLEAAKRAGNQASAEKLRELESAVEEAKRKRVSYRRYIAQVRVESSLNDSDQFRADELRQDLSYLKRLQESIKLKLASLEFEIGQEAYRITVQDKAAVPQMPSNNRRFTLMAVTSLGCYFLILGLFLVRRIAAPRVAAPEAAS
jgi:uncharacterized protein involved in exopolysaccharide biosynthesis